MFSSMDSELETHFWIWSHFQLNLYVWLKEESESFRLQNTSWQQLNVNTDEILQMLNLRLWPEVFLTCLAVVFCFFFAKSARKGKVEVAAGPSSCPRSLRSLRRFDGSATCPRPRQLFHHERHLSHRASSSRKLQLKPKVTALSDMYPGRVGMNSAISARSLLNPKIHSLTRASWWIWTSLGEGR